MVSKNRISIPHDVLSGDFEDGRIKSEQNSKYILTVFCYLKIF